MPRRSLTVYCASSCDIDEKYKLAAREVGRLCAVHGWRLINGAGSEGLMGATSDGCLEAGGEVLGIIPQWMIDKGWMREGLSECIVTNDMAVRKQAMRDNCDAVLVLPGGFGTMEEFFETVTARQIGLFHKPIILFNQDHYYDHIEQWKFHSHREQFLRHENDLELWATIQHTDQLMPLLDTLCP